MDIIKSIAVPATRRRANAKTRKAGRPDAAADSKVGGSVGPGRRAALPITKVRAHSYSVGQRLDLRGGGNSLSRSASTCQVVALLPHEGGPFLYRVRSDVETYERIVAEADLTPAL